MILISLAQFQLHLGRTVQLYVQNLSPFLSFPQPGRKPPCGWEECLLSKRTRKQLPTGQNSHPDVSSVTHICRLSIKAPRFLRSWSNPARAAHVRCTTCNESRLFAGIHTIIMATKLTLYLVTVLIPVQVQ